MSRQEWTTDDKSGWGDGPWRDEPDKVVWIDPATDLDCMIHRNRVGGLCGYVGVGPDHPWHRKEYTELGFLDVHGGLTFSDLCDPEAAEEHGICHVPLHGRPHDVWWLGFDCVHAMDLAPGMAADQRELARRARERGDIEVAELFERSDTILRGTYRTIAYVENEVKRLAQQVAEA